LAQQAVKTDIFSWKTAAAHSRSLLATCWLLTDDADQGTPCMGWCLSSTLGDNCHATHRELGCL